MPMMRPRWCAVSIVRLAVSDKQCAVVEAEMMAAVVVALVVVVVILG